jgi:hypothetical protein
MGTKKSEATNTIRIGLTDEDVRFIARQKAALIDTRKEIFRCLKVVVELNRDGDFMSEDEKAVLVDLAEKWLRVYPPASQQAVKSLKDCQTDVVDELVQKIERMLAEFEPICQTKVLSMLKRSLPIEE